MTAPLLAAALVAAVVAELVRAHAARLGLVDAPGGRSSHSRPTPRGAGLGIALGVAAGAAFGGLGSEAIALLCAAQVVGLLGLVDDRRPLPPIPKLAVLATAAVAALVAAGPFERLPLPSPLDLPLGAAAIPFTLLWIVAITNFFNFMDGLDGLATGQLVLSGAVAWAAGWSADAQLLGALAAVSAAVLLPSNWSPARFFLGDAGSLFSGFLLAVLPLLAPTPSRSGAGVVTATALGCFLLDPLATLLRRARRGAPLLSGHREHAYQRLAAAAGSHARVVAGVLLLQALAAGAALAVARDREIALFGPAAALLLSAILVVAAARLPERP